MSPKKKLVKKAATKKKVAVKKKSVTKKVVTKKVVTQKVVTKKRVATKKRVVNKKSTRSLVSARERYEMIATMAYYRAEKRNFDQGHDYQDWLECELIVDQMLGK